MDTQALPSTNVVSCHDYQYKLIPHARNTAPRYISSSSGKCKPLAVQSLHGPYQGNIVPVTDHRDKTIGLSSYLVNYQHLKQEPKTWFLKYFAFMGYLIILTFNRTKYTSKYRPFVQMYWGQFWDARSKKEYSRHESAIMRPREDGSTGPVPVPPQIPPPPLQPALSTEGPEYQLPEQQPPVSQNPAVVNGFPMNATGSLPAVTGGTQYLDRITRARWPRQLILLERANKTDSWVPSTDVTRMRTANYLAVSYRRAHFLPHTSAYDVMLRSVQESCIAWGLDGYWLDEQCIGTTPVEKNLDVYRIADVFRGAKRTLIVVGSGANESWYGWGERVWTLPELLLSKNLYVQDNFESESTTPRQMDLRQIANMAFREDDRVLMDEVIDHYSGKDIMDRLERLSKLKDAIWRRQKSDRPPDVGPQFAGYDAERVYALMGFFEHRILPDQLESELNALARLSMANDSDRFVERMICMYPNEIRTEACWYAEDDKYEAQLWDIEPLLVAAGTTTNGALVLDGCLAASIRWKDFPKVAFSTKGSFKRTPSLFLSRNSVWIMVVCALIFGPIARYDHPLAVILVLAAVIFLASPWLLWYGISGRIVSSQPWLVGVQGFMSASEAAERLYGARGTRFGEVSHSPSGSPFARYDTGPRRIGDTKESEKASKSVSLTAGMRPYTIVDSLSRVVYHFTARRPPTVCVFGGREGGLGRFILCSEVCEYNELHKEAVLRMPTWVSRRMSPCDWLAIGTRDKDSQELNQVEPSMPECLPTQEATAG
jgi:hypothetical protein